MASPSPRLDEWLASPDRQVVVIAEVGVNHNGDPALAHRMIDDAAEAGSDLVKFQTFDPATLVSAEAAAAPYQRREGTTLQAEMLASLVLPETAWAELSKHCQERGVEFMSTPFDLPSAEMLVGLGVPALKVPSGELTNTPFIRRLARLGKPLLISTGMGSRTEVMQALEAAASAPGVALFHCVSAYPAPIEECNLRAIPAMADEFGVPVGWSDHTAGQASAVAAVALGARLLEKHFTIDRNLPGPDHKASLEPAELASYVEAVHQTRTALGDGVKRRMPSEQENAALARRSWHAARDLEAGLVLAEDDVVALRPEVGVMPSEPVAGRTLARAVPRGQPIVADAIAAT